MVDPISGHILRKLGEPGLVRKMISAVSFSKLQSLLMEVFDEKRKTLRVSGILDQYRSDPFVRPSPVDQGVQREFDTYAEAALPPGCSVIELSPVSPLGCCSQLAGVSQDRIVTTIRKSEVCSDPTNVLALEASLRRKNGIPTVRLATSHRVLRVDRRLDEVSFAHFRIWSLCIAGRDTGEYRFETAAAGEVMGAYERLLHTLSGNGYPFSRAELVVKFRDRGRMVKYEAREDRWKPGAGGIALRLEVDEKENWSYYATMRLQL